MMKRFILSMVLGRALAGYGAALFLLDYVAAEKIDLEQVRNALSTGSLQLPAGSLYGASKSYTVQSSSQLTTAPHFAQLIVTLSFLRTTNPSLPGSTTSFAVPMARMPTSARADARAGESP